ncbi:hypothetical protein BDR05DRAFT_952284 [Suillus weaverae]|nr:hypothetical protein BDR05DRAFT_952284 [Suillus weaverae]
MTRIDYGLNEWKGKTGVGIWGLWMEREKCCRGAEGRLDTQIAPTTDATQAKDDKLLPDFLMMGGTVFICVSCTPYGNHHRSSARRRPLILPSLGNGSVLLPRLSMLFCRSSPLTSTKLPNFSNVQGVLSSLIVGLMSSKLSLQCRIDRYAFVRVHFQSLGFDDFCAKLQTLVVAPLLVTQIQQQHAGQSQG